MVNYGYLLFNEMVSYGRNCGISMGYGMAVEHYSKLNVWGKNNGISIDIEWIYLLYSIVYMGYFVINPCSYGFCLDSCLNSQPTYIGGG